MAGTDQTSDPSAPDSRVRFEVLLVLGLLLFGLVVLPALIYLVGTFLLGPYGGGGRLGAFYGDVLRDLGDGSGRAWILLAGPLLLFQLGRLIFFRFGADDDEPAPRAPAGANRKPTASGASPPRAQPDVRQRREPTIKF